jgi:hypothetical protein
LIYSPPNTFNKTHFTNSGKLRKLDDNTGKGDAEGVGINAPIFMFDMAAGGSGWYGGLIWGYSLWGVDDVVGSGSIAINEKQTVIQHLGLSLKKGFGSPIGPSIVSLEANRLTMLYEGQDYKRKGIESALTYKVYSNSDNGAFKGLYAEAYYRFQTFNSFKGEVNPSVAEKPNLTMQSIGVKVGAVLSWW